MHSFPVSVLSPTVCFLLPFPDSLPQPFLRCLLPAFAFRIFRFPSALFRLLSVPLPATRPSVSSVPFFPALPHSGFPGAPSPLSLPGLPHSFLPGFPCILSWFPYLAFCWFPFVLPCFAPAAVPQVIPFQISPPGPVLDFRFFQSFHFSISLLSLCFFFSLFFLILPHSGFLRRPFRSRFFGFPRSLQPDLSCFPSRFRYSAFCLFPFVLPCFAPTAVPQVLAFCFRLRPFPFCFRFLSSASFPVLTTQPSVLPFPSS